MNVLTYIVLDVSKHAVQPEVPCDCHTDAWKPIERLFDYLFEHV